MILNRIFFINGTLYRFKRISVKTQIRFINGFIMKNYRVKARRYFMGPLIWVLLGFIVCFCFGSVLNILLKTTGKRDWLITFFISLGIAIIAVPILLN